MTEYTKCVYCRKQSPANLSKCMWCLRPIHTRGWKILHELVLWGSIVGILAAAFVAYQIGGWS